MSNFFHNIPEIPKNESATNATARFVDAIGFRLKWATEGLTENEFNFRPHPTSMSMHELLVHLHGMAFFTYKNFGGTKDKAPSLDGFMEIRDETLEIYKRLSNHLKKMDDKDLETILIQRKTPPSTLSFWFMLNGPIADSLTHIGQLSSWRRIAGNPQPDGVDHFLGLKN